MINKLRYFNFFNQKINFKTNNNRIELDLIFNCNLNCLNCDRSCRQAPSNEYLSIKQIKKFIRESIESNRKWEYINLMGGEPTTHPDIIKICKLILEYKNNFSKNSKIFLLTNGFGIKTKEILKKIPIEIKIINSNKTSIIQNFKSVNLASIDLYKGRKINYSNGCKITEICGINLNKYGYYPCGAGGMVDRVFGFNLGLKSLPDKNYNFKKELNQLCKYCSHFNKEKLVNYEVMSKSWKIAYKNYNFKQPILKKY